MVFEHSQTMKFTRQHKLIGFAVHSMAGLWPLIRLNSRHPKRIETVCTSYTSTRNLAG